MADSTTTIDGELGANATQQIKGFAERAARLFNDRDELNEDIKAVFNEAKESGLDSKILRKAIMRVRKGLAQRRTEEEQIALYERAILELPLFADAGVSSEPKNPKGGDVGLKVETPAQKASRLLAEENPAFGPTETEQKLETVQ